MSQMPKELTDNTLVQFNTDRSIELEGHITNLNLRMQEIHTYILSINQNITQLENIVVFEQSQKQPNYDKIRKLRDAITKNVELISTLYDTYRGFEETKFKYNKEINDNSYKYHHLVAVDLQRLNKKMDDAGHLFFQIMESINKGFSYNKDPLDDGPKSPLLEQADTELEEDDKYRL